MRVLCLESANGYLHLTYTYFSTLEAIETGAVSWIGHNKQNIANKLLLNFLAKSSGKHLRTLFVSHQDKETMYQQARKPLSSSGNQYSNSLKNNFPY